MFWSIIAANKRKTVLLIVGMGFFLILTGFVVGMSFAEGYNLNAGIIGACIATVIWIVMLLVSLLASDSLLLGAAGAHEIDRALCPELYNVAEEMVIAGSLSHAPKVYVVDDPSPNAFAFGKSPENSCVCVTAGLLAVCTRDELQGVVAHEIGHIMNRDVLYMTVAATMLGAILLISEVFVKTFRFSPVRFTSRSRRIGGGAGVVILLSLVLSILGPVLARILYYSISRRREYLADATSARLTRYPEGLASALEKIGGSPDVMSTAPQVIAPFYIVRPGRQNLTDDMFATHPPLEERIAILRGMSQGAGFVEYLKAYAKVTRTRKSLIPQADLGRVGEKVEIRAPSGAKEPLPVSRIEARRRAGDIIRVMNHFSFIPCLCGMRIKVPPEYPSDRIACPRCGRGHKVKKPDSGTFASVLSGSCGVDRAPSRANEANVGTGGYGGQTGQEVRFVPGSWQKFTCSACGHSHELSPRFSGLKIVCSGCGSVIRLIHENNEGHSLGDGLV